MNLLASLKVHHLNRVNLIPFQLWFCDSQCYDIPLPVITRIVNRSLQYGQFPDVLRMAFIAALLKKYTCDSEILSKYRPISNLPFISKCYETVVALQLNQHLQDNCLHTALKVKLAEQVFHFQNHGHITTENDFPAV